MLQDVSHANRRIHARRITRVAARLVHADGAVDGVIENIGAGGAFFATEDLELKTEEGASAKLTFRCKKDGRDVEMTRAGTVLRADLHFDGKSVVRSFAVQFDEADPLDGCEFA